MPISKRSTDLFPLNLFDLPDDEFPWWVAHVRSRQEKVLARHLLPLNIPFYLPQREKRVRRAGRTFVSYLPLFPGYVFFRGSADARHSALRSNLIVKVLEVNEPLRLADELFQLRRLEESGADLLPFFDFSPGDAVRITEGPFRGYSGVLQRAAGRVRLLVSISMLRQTVAVEFERAVVAPVRPACSDSQGRQDVTVS
ncbi:MAG TPA: transcription termination/antitermination NusG family protein [Thermoanaerobaculia bacterium]|nr:transcription termination/antitermination NusG family protein [Thermoanaerobaculia bacterium]